jgi:outer membrane protein
MKFYLSAFILCQLFVSAAVIAQEEAPEQPTWELGAGLALVSLPHYPGSNQSSTLLAPFPYPVYQSENINLDEEGLVASVAESGRFSLKASVNGSLPVSDKDNDARLGMDDLDLLIEAGPSVHVSLATWGDSELRVELPVRAAFKITTKDFPEYTGWTSNPGLYYETEFDSWHWESSIGAIWSSSDYHGFFYDVDTEYATGLRPVYKSEAGFTGWRSSVTVKRRWGDFIGIGYVRYMNFSGADNADSPLLIEDNYIAAGVSLVYMLFGSR